MRSWIFQGNPDVFDIDGYISDHDEITWSVNQEHYAEDMAPDDEVFLWRAGGKDRATAGVVARCVLSGEPEVLRDDAAAKGYWTQGDPEDLALRVPMKVVDRRLGPKEVVKRIWLEKDPILSEHAILTRRTGTNFRLRSNEAERLSDLVRNTGRDWNREESLAGLWAYKETLGGQVSRTVGSPVVEVALTIGRAIGGVYNKVMNFRAIDPRDSRKGLTGGGQTDEQVWAEFYDETTRSLDTERLDGEYRSLWGRSSSHEERIVHPEFGEARNDDLVQMQSFAARVRKGQGKFRANLLRAYGQRCCISGHGPEEVLEAVHILPHSATGLNELDNGLLLRSDLHHLFDQRLLEIDPEGLVVEIDPVLEGTPYWDLNGRTLARREDGGRPSKEYLNRWREQSDEGSAAIS